MASENLVGWARIDPSRQMCERVRLFATNSLEIDRRIVSQSREEIGRRPVAP
jgi:hypothetical protein